MATTPTTTQTTEQRRAVENLARRHAGRYLTGERLAEYMDDLDRGVIDWD